MSSNNKCYVTTPIYYVNAKPHLGTLYSTILGDATARWNKLMGKEVFFLTGTDEHGQKIQERAQQEGKDPKTFVDSMIAPFKDVWKLYNIQYDHFIRTTDHDHEQAVISWIKQLQAQGDIYKAEYSGWYCVPDETFVNVESEPVRDEKGNFVCPSCKRELRQLSEESYFFKLSAYQDRLLKFYEEHPDFITPKERLNEVISFVKSGLKDLSISRKTVSWGIPFPGDAAHTVYVWGDALNNYISAIGYGKQDAKNKAMFAHWWPADIHIMAKDIVRFHAVYWPAFLMAAGLQMPKRLLVHGYILIDQQKMSKSLGNAVDPVDLAKTYGIDAVRYYLLRKMAVTQDGSFSIQDLEEHVTADLANNLGNLLNRTLALAVKNDLLVVKPSAQMSIKSSELRKRFIEMYQQFHDEMNKGYFHMALATLWRFISEVNAYFHEHQPWALVKQDRQAFEEVISVVCHALESIALMLWPIMPDKMIVLLKSLSIEFVLGQDYDAALHKADWDKEFILIPGAEPLFVKPEPRLIQEKGPSAMQETKQETTSAISIDEFLKVDMRVGTIVSCELVKGSEKLYRLEVDLGEIGRRQILSGVAQHFTIEQMLGKQGAFIVNLAPRKMMGLESHGMMLFAKDAEGKMQIVTYSNAISNASKLC